MLLIYNDYDHYSFLMMTDYGQMVLHFFFNYSLYICIEVLNRCGLDELPLIKQVAQTISHRNFKNLFST